MRLALAGGASAKMWAENVASIELISLKTRQHLG
jgi:hypothetical protein